MLSGKPYSGLKRKLVLGIDVGTTYSGVSYILLDPGEVPNIQNVTRYPGQEQGGDAKVPTILYYTQEGAVHAAGAEAAAPSMKLDQEDYDLLFVEWFKLHLLPENMKSAEIGNTMSPLPLQKSVVDVLADFLAYLFQCTKQYIVETHPNGDSLWDSVSGDIEFVLSHPNGWGGSQQRKMRQAAVMANLVPDDDTGRSRILFVTEGEASVHYCIDKGITGDSVKDGSTIILVDAGGGTVDIATYTFVSSIPILVEEVAPPDCILEGSTRVNVRARTFLESKLATSQFGNEEDINAMIDAFEQQAKPTFKDDRDRSYLKFGSMRDKDLDHGIRSGQLTLEGAEVAKFFAPSISRIVDAVQAQRLISRKSISTVYLVGGFSSSPWLFKKLQLALTDHGISLCRADGPGQKSVALGALSFYLDHFVSVRMMRFAYGTNCVIEYDPQDPEHIKRRAKAYTRPSGRKVIPNNFKMILAKGTKLRENDEVSQSFYKETTSPSALNKISSTIVCYRGALHAPRWIDAEPEQFTTLCTVFADTSKVKKERKVRDGSVFYIQDFKIVLLCGLTEFQAQISWMEDGQERRGPAKIVYDDDTEAIV